MRKHLFLLWIGVAALTACGDDDTPVTPVLNKVTKISCYQNGGTTPLFTADINYTGEGNLSNIRFSGTQNLLFIYTGDKFTVTDTGSGTTTAEYTLSGNVITRMTVSKENPYASNEVYVSDEYVYQYTGSSLTRTAWTARWPREDEAGYAGYEERMYSMLQYRSSPPPPRRALAILHCPPEGNHRTAETDPECADPPCPPRRTPPLFHLQH